MELVRRHFSVIGVDELIAGFEGVPLPPNPCLITFDDGYRSNLEVALPILRDFGLRAVLFVATSFVDQRKLYWWDRIAWLVARARVRELRLTYPREQTVSLADRPRARGTLHGIVKDEGGLDLDRSGCRAGGEKRNGCNECA